MSNTKPDFAVTLANHWSYIGIGWTYGIESCVVSINDSLTVAEPPLGLKTCINLDAAAYELITENFPEVIDNLKKHLKTGRVEIIGGTYSQPLGTMIGNESNIRQLVIGRKVIKKYLGEGVDTFLEEEEFSHPQLPQLLKLAGYQYASLAQCDTVGTSGIPRVETNCFLWQAKDGTVIPCIPKNSLFLHPPCVTADIDYYETPEGKANIAELKQSGVPLAVVWTEFGWEPLGEIQYHTKFDPGKYHGLKQRTHVVFVTIKEYMGKYAKPADTLEFSMDDYDKILPWGIGGDQLRVNDRKAEALLISAERFDAFSYMLCPERNMCEFEDIWKDLLTAQSHDVSLCEYIQWQRLIFFERNRLYNTHEMLWGAIGYTYLDKAISSGNKILGDSLETIASKIDSSTDAQGDLAVTVFNPCTWERKGLVVSTGKMYLKDTHAKGIVMVDAQGKAVPSQIISSKTDSDSNIVTADVAFEVESMPAAGYVTYYVRFMNEEVRKDVHELKINKEDLEIENDYVRISFDKTNGSIISLFDKNTGKELLDSKNQGSTIFNGRVNRKYCEQNGLEILPEHYDTSSSKASFSWIEEGPLRASVCVRHFYPQVSFETVTTLHFNSPKVEIACRLRAIAPPAVDKKEAGIWNFEGYWLDFSPGFGINKVYRDVPFGVESAAKSTFHGFSFVDMVGDDRALMLVHSGTQYFKWKNGNILSNLLMREWNAVCGGFQSYCEYKYFLIPHDIAISNQDRLQMSMEMDYTAKAVVNRPAKGSLAKEMSLLGVYGEGVVTSCFRRKGDKGFEIRLFETEGKQTTVRVEFAIPVEEGYDTDLMGNRIDQLQKAGGNSFEVVLKPWQITTLEVI
jgi:alpha-mannosidase